MTVTLCPLCDGAGVRLRRGTIEPCHACHGGCLTVTEHQPAHQPRPWTRPEKRAS